MKNKRYSASKPLLAFLVILFLMPLVVHAAWYNTNWQYRKTITIDNTKVEANLTNFAVLISITDTDLRDEAQNDGDDILFTSSDGTTKLSHEIEKFDGITGELVAWVKVPSLSSSSDTVLYMYYGNASASSQQDAPNVWDSNYKCVLHLKEDPSGTAPQMQDSTSNANHTTSQGSMTSGDQVTGKIDGSLDFDATNDYISRTYDSDFDFGTGSFSVTGWFKTSGPTGSLTGGASSETISVRVSQSSDDAEENVSSGGMSLTSTDVELVKDGSTDQEVGMRFQSVTIPQGATIVSAYIQFTVDETDSGTTNLTFYGEDTDNASTFTSSANNITGRTKTTASTAWNAVPAWSSVGAAGADQKSPNLNAVIQEIVDRSGWSSGNSLVVIVDGTGERTAESYNGSSSQAPLLTVTYTLEQELVSRFNDAGFKISMREDGKVYAGFNDDSVWSASPDVALTSSNTFDDNSWHHFAVVKSGNSAAYLYIDGSLEDSDTSLTIATDLSIQVSAGTDDAEENVSSGSMNLTSTDLELVYEGAVDQEVGMRFQNVTIPQGITINSAYIQYTVDETDSGTTNLTFYGEDTDNASTFTSSANNITNRTKTSASVAWNSVPAWSSVGAAGADQKTPDLKTIIQEIVDRAGWSSGNSLVIIVDGTGERTAESYNGSSSDAPLLLINYDLPFGTLSSSSSAPLHVGADAATAIRYFSGIVDEIKISNTARSSGWIETSYNNQNSPGTFYSVGSEAAVPTPTYLKVTGNGSMTAGGTNQLTITAYDQYDNVATSYTGSKSLTFSGPSNAPSGTVPTVEGTNVGSATTVAFTNGVSDSGAATLKAYKAETTTVDVTDGSINSTGNASYDLDLTVSAGSANNLAYNQQPSNTAAGATISPAITVQVRDQWNNVRTSDSSTSVAIAINNNPGSGTLSGTTSQTASSGVATFNDLSINNTGTGYTLDATSSGLTSAISDAFNITAGSASYLKVTGTASVAAGANNELTITAYDSNDNVATSYTGSKSLTFSGPSNAPSGTVPTVEGTNIGSATSVNFTNGVSDSGAATLKAYKAETTTVDVTDGSINSTGNASYDLDLTVSAGSANNLAYNQQPSNTAAGTTISPAITVQVRDQWNNVRTSDSSTSVAIAINNNPGSGTLSGTTSQTASSGVATFNDLSINNTGTGYTLDATSSGLTSATSDAFNITSGSATKLAFNQQPTNTVAGSTISPAITVQILDSNDNLVTSATDSVTIAIANNPGSGTLSGTKTKAASGGVATFNNLSINNTGTGYTLRVTSGSLTAAASDAFNITVGSAAKLSFDQQPTSAAAAATISPAVTIQILDSNDNLLTSATDSVTIAFGNNAGGGTLSGTLTKAAVSGVATFNDLSIDRIGAGYTLTVTSGSLTSDTSDAFAITQGAAGYLRVTGTASMTAGGTNELTITAYDAYGNVATGYAGSKSITFSGPSNASDGTVPTVEGTNFGSATTVNFTNGRSNSGAATLTAYKAETTTVDVTDGTIHSQGSTSYDLDLTVNAASAAAISYVSGNNQSGTSGSALSNYCVVKVTDDYGNAVSGKTVTWNITTTPTGATGQSLSSETTTSDSDGKAQSQLTLGNKTGTYQVQASASSVSGSPITFSATANSNDAQNISLVSGSCQTGNANTALSNPFVVKVTDGDGNAVSGVSVGCSVTTSPTDATGYSLSSETTTTDSDGEAQVTLTLGDKAGLYKVEASVSGLNGSPVSFTAITDTSIFVKGSKYRTFSIPYQLSSGNAESVLNLLGPYDTTKWRLFRYNGGGYLEYPNTPDFSPGLSYWLISVDDKAVAVSGSAVSSSVTVTLEPGWNQIGCPFTCSVTWAVVMSANADLFHNNIVSSTLWGYDAGQLEFVLSTQLDPWQSYWVYNASDSQVTLIIPYQ